MYILPFIPALVCGCAVYMHCKSQNLKNRAGELFWKAAASLMFVLCAALAYAASPGKVPAAYGFMLAGLVLSLLGDVLLSMNAKLFLPGAVCFGLAHLGYTISFFIRFSFSGWFFMFAAVFAAICLGVLRLNRGISLGKESGLATGYALIISLMAGAAFMGLFTPGAGGWLAALGAALFTISDVLLAFGRYGPGGRSINTANAVTYYAGQILLALSLMFM